MLWKIVLLAGSMLAPSAASAATFVIMTDPMSLERRTMVLNTPGPDRVLICAAPPAVSGCREIPFRRSG